MLNLNTIRISAGRLTAALVLLSLIALVVTVGAVAAHAQVCYQVPLHQADWYPTGPYTGYWGPCLHIVTRCN
jgi:hypothetical protein